MLSQRRPAPEMTHIRLISLGSDQTPPKDETVLGPDNGLLARLGNSEQPTFVEPPARIYWPANLQSQIKKSTFKIDYLIGRGSDEFFQLTFHGACFVAVQPSEGQPVVASS